MTQASPVAATQAAAEVQQETKMRQTSSAAAEVLQGTTLTPQASAEVLQGMTMTQMPSAVAAATLRRAARAEDPRSCRWRSGEQGRPRGCRMLSWQGPRGRHASWRGSRWRCGGPPAPPTAVPRGAVAGLVWLRNCCGWSLPPALGRGRGLPKPGRRWRRRPGRRPPLLPPRQVAPAAPPAAALPPPAPPPPRPPYSPAVLPRLR
mmetsp:Transcript_2272/g.6781  ORF Transcript_2272/g.6781 Transcript_2272/m.6781 type:complete len:205 (+) Transcript_2272:4911-5525(+)